MSTITINRSLEVHPGNVIFVPGCEPASDVTSPTLLNYQLKYGLCKNATVDLAVVLVAIPGAVVVFGDNFNAPRQRWLHLPPFDPEDCPCPGETDWYGVIRRLATEEVVTEERFDYCNTLGQGYCPSPDFSGIAPPPESPYVKEGYSESLNRYTP